MKARILQTTKLLAVAAVLTAHAAPALADPAPPAPPPDEKVPRALIALRSELGTAGAAKALARMPHFRPLCDERGYPLVGNMNNKGPSYEPSAFCAAVRGAKAGS